MKIMLVLAGFVLMIASFVISTSDMAQAEKVLGTGTGSLIGGDLTDPEDDGNPEADKGYNAIFSSSDNLGLSRSYVCDTLHSKLRCDKDQGEDIHSPVIIDITYENITALPEWVSANLTLLAKSTLADVHR
jgi:hypothetical protein